MSGHGRAFVFLRPGSARRGRGAEGGARRPSEGRKQPDARPVAGASV